MMIVQVIGAFVAVCAVSITYGVSRRFLFFSGFAGAFSWMIYLLMLKVEANEIFGVFVATLAAALISNIFARILKAPVTTFLIPSILPTVPGVGMYRIVYYMIIGDMDTAGYYLTYVLQIAGMIAIGIFIIETIFRTFVKKEYLQKKQNI